jgi:hypothetical protein
MTDTEKEILARLNKILDEVAIDPIMVMIEADNSK